MHGREAATHVNRDANADVGEIRVSMRRGRRQGTLDGRHKREKGLQRTPLKIEAACIILDPFGLL